jgi:hypothetical protein
MYRRYNQSSITPENFELPFAEKLSPDNRWVIMDEKVRNAIEVLLTEEMQTKGVVLIHHLRSVDWKTRGIKFVEQAPISVIEEICAKLKPLLF